MVWKRQDWRNPVGYVLGESKLNQGFEACSLHIALCGWILPPPPSSSVSFTLPALFIVSNCGHHVGKGSCFQPNPCQGALLPARLWGTTASKLGLGDPEISIASLTLSGLLSCPKSSPIWIIKTGENWLQKMVWSPLYNYLSDTSKKVELVLWATSSSTPNSKVFSWAYLVFWI